LRNILKKQTEQEGFEPPEPFGSMVFKTTEANPQGMSNKELTETAETRLQASLQEHPEIEPNSAPDRPTAQAEMISTLADLLAALPDSDRAGIIADLPQDQRLAIARLIARRITEDSSNE